MLGFIIAKQFLIFFDLPFTKTSLITTSPVMISYHQQSTHTFYLQLCTFRFSTKKNKVEAAPLRFVATVLNLSFLRKHQTMTTAWEGLHSQHKDTDYVQYLSQHRLILQLVIKCKTLMSNKFQLVILQTPLLQTLLLTIHPLPIKQLIYKHQSDDNCSFNLKSNFLALSGKSGGC